MIRSAHTLLALAAFGLVSIATPSLAGERVLSTIGGWRIVLNLNKDNSFNRCIMQADQKGHMLRLAFDGKSMDSSLSVPAAGHKAGSDGFIGFNGSQTEVFAFNADKSRAWTRLNWDMTRMFEAARSIEVSVGKAEFQWKLADTTKAMVAVTDCVNQYAG